ncbi:MAG: winged helix-turn-helix domain-containing protein [Nitrososphaerales archaeon]|nr:winged helix-turn-helix domain-containing protein [Nitrososphaerales archaeon]
MNGGFPSPFRFPPHLLDLILQLAGKSGASPTESLEPSFKRLMVYLFVGTRGGQNRAKIVDLLSGEPSNPNKISEKLELDYKTVQHHIKVLEENGVIVASAKETYGAIYFFTPYFEKHYQTIRRMWAGFGQS